jgi:hypothetical protein
VIATICTIVAGPGSGKTMSIAPAGGPSAIPPRYRLCSPGLRPGALAPLCPRSRTDR